jgi:hypothetical protein
MTKWADYGISAVRYSATRKHIDKVRVHADNGDTIGTGVEGARSDVISALKRGSTFVTILKSSDDKWKKGASVHIFTVRGTEYIKTVDNGKEEDNLGSLPEF